MSETLREMRKERASGEAVERYAWGLLLVWVGAVLLLHWGWGVGLVGAGAIVLAAHAWRGHLGLRLDLWGVVFGVMLLVCGVWTLFEVPIELVPLLAIAAGIGLLVSTRRASHPRPGAPADAHAASHRRA